jgi:hypothetical protein
MASLGRVVTEAIVLHAGRASAQPTLRRHDGAAAREAADAAQGPGDDWTSPTSTEDPVRGSVELSPQFGHAAFMSRGAGRSWAVGFAALLSACEGGAADIDGPVDAPIDLLDLQVDPDRIPVIRAHDDVPVDTSAWTVVPYSGPPTGEAVSAAIAAAAPETILELPAGTYSGTLDHRASSVLVRGDCQDRGAVVWEHAGIPQNIVYDQETLCDPGWVQMCGAQVGDARDEVFADRTTWTGGFSRLSRTIAVDDASAYTVGDMVWLRSDAVGDPRESVQTDSLTYMAEVVEVVGDQITLDRGLPIDFGSSGASVARVGRLQRDAGIECMTLRSTDADDPAGIYVNVAFTIALSTDSWIRNVDFGDTFNRFGTISRAARTVVIGNRFGDQLKSRRGDGNTCDGAAPVEDNPCWNKQTLVYLRAHDNAFIDNVVEASIGLEFAEGASRNWVAYNYFPEPALHPAGEPRRALFPHGNYAHTSVLEGNVMWGVGEMDTVWGSQGPRYTWFRNVAVGPVARFSTEAWAEAPEQFILGRYANYLLNHGRDFTLNSGGPIDTRSDAMHLERNTFTGRLVTGDPTSRETVVLDNWDASASPLGDAWDDLRFPDSLNRLVDGAPAFWCSNTVSKGGPVCDFAIDADSVGALWDGECKLPAQQRFEGGACD